MPRKFHKPLRFLLVSVFVTLLLVVPTSQAHADVAGFFGAVGDVISDAVQSLIKTAVFGIMDAFTALLILFLQFVGGILKWVMSPDFNNGIIRQPFVQQGWAIVRDFANMFFVVILVIIAIATILRQENLGIRRTLPTLIIIALLVNFSLILVGFVVDVSQIFMVYFLGAFSDKDFTTVLVNATSFDKLFSSTSINWDADMNSWEELGVRFALKAMRLLALTFAIAVVALLAVLFVIRTVILWVVAILAPLAFVSYILPASRGLWNSWLKQLTNWALFGPAAVFFLFLAGKLMESMSSGGPMADFGQGAAGLGDLGGGSEFMGHGAPFLQAAVIFTFIFLAINSAKMFTGGVGNMVAGKIEGWRRGAVRGAVGIAGKGAAIGAERVTRRPRRRVRERLERIPFVGPIVGGPGRARAEAQAEIDKRAGKHQAKTTEELRESMGQLGVDPRERASMLKVLAGRRKLENQDFKYFKGSIREGMNVNEALAVRPDWAKHVKGRSIEEDVGKTRPSDMAMWHPEAYDDPGVQRELAKLSPEHIMVAARTISRVELGRVQAALDSQADEIEKTNPELNRFLSNYQGKRLGLKTPIKGREHEAALEEYGKFLDEQEELLAEESVKNLYERLQADIADALKDLRRRETMGPPKEPPGGLPIPSTEFQKGGKYEPPEVPPGPEIPPGPTIPPPGGAPPAPTPPRRPPGGGGGTVRVSNNVIDSIRKTEQGDIPAFLTNDTRRVLRELGLSPAQINRMNPDEAWRRIATAYREGKVVGPGG